MDDEIVIQFAAWVDRVLAQQDLSPVVVYNFNLYEHVDETAVQLVGATYYDPRIEDWACSPYFSSGEDLFLLPYSLCGPCWRTTQQFVIDLVTDYLQRCPTPGPLKTSRAISVGFVDGSLELVYSQPDARNLS